MFRFRHFIVEDEKSTMRVGTDAMILGSWAWCPPTGKVLEIGTGCGVISLMVAQRSETQITAIDIHLPSIEQASENFNKSRWNSRLSAIHTSLEKFTDTCSDRFDLIISNPPFFKNSLKSPTPERNLSRHDENLTFESLVKNSFRLVTPSGRIIFILPSAEAEKAKEIARQQGLFTVNELYIFSTPENLFPVRTIMVLSPDHSLHEKDEFLIIRDKNGNYTPEYLTLTEEFHNFN